MATAHSTTPRSCAGSNGSVGRNGSNEHRPRGGGARRSRQTPRVPKRFASRLGTYSTPSRELSPPTRSGAHRLPAWMPAVPREIQPSVWPVRRRRRTEGGDGGSRAQAVACDERGAAVSRWRNAPGAAPSTQMRSAAQVNSPSRLDPVAPSRRSPQRRAGRQIRVGRKDVQCTAPSQVVGD
jgi:hypothetical protein